MSKTIQFIVDNLSYFETKNNLKQYNKIIQNINYKPTNKIEYYRNFNQFLLKINKTLLSTDEKDIMLELLSALKVKYSYEYDNKTKWVTKIYQKNDFLFFKIKNGMLNNKKQILIYFKFYYNKELFQLIKNSFQDFSFNKTTNAVIVPFSEQDFIKLLNNEWFKENIKLIIDLDGIDFYLKNK